MKFWRNFIATTPATMSNLRQPLHDLSLATGALSPQCAALIGGALTALAELDAKEKAFMTVCRAVDPAGRLSPTGLSIALSSDFRRFKSAAAERIAKGHRPVSNDIEAAWVVLCGSDCPESPRRIRDWIKRFDGT